METYAFANILFSGPCNLACPHCIGGRLPVQSELNNLDEFPIRGFDEFCSALVRHRVRQVSLTGANTDPQLYRHQARLIQLLRTRVPGIVLSLHTNGRRALTDPELFNSYDRATISLPSFDPATYQAMTGRRGPIDLEAIAGMARIPLKVSTLLTEQNIDQIPALLSRCRDLGIRRVVLRKLYGETREWDLFQGLSPVRSFAGNPVYDLRGMEVTLWDFNRSDLSCINLFADGTIGTEYELTRNMR